jgi:hypothetical protein
VLLKTNDAINEAMKIKEIIATNDLLIPNNEAVLLIESLPFPNPARSSPTREKSTIASMANSAVSFQNACKPHPKMKIKTYLSA